MSSNSEHNSSVIERTRLIEIRADEEWRQQWHDVGCYTVKDVLRVDPNEARGRNFYELNQKLWFITYDGLEISFKRNR